MHPPGCQFVAFNGFYSLQCSLKPARAWARFCVGSPLGPYCSCHKLHNKLTFLVLASLTDVHVLRSTSVLGTYIFGSLPLKYCRFHSRMFDSNEIRLLHPVVVYPLRGFLYSTHLSYSPSRLSFDSSGCFYIF
jgi:hypothetical protein